MSQRFEDILDECLTLIAQGKGVEACLARYPDQAKELEPLLRLALRGQRAFGSVHPSSAAMTAGRERLLAALARRRPQPRPVLVFLPRRLVPVLASLLAAVVLGTGTVMAASGSLPGEPLYPVKMAAEQARFSLTPSPAARARLLVELSDRRVEEIAALEEEGEGEVPEIAQARRMEKVRRLEAVRRRLGEHLSRLSVLAEGMDSEGAQRERVLRLMALSLERHRQRLAPPAEGGPPAPSPVPAPPSLPSAREMAPAGAPPAFAPALGLRAAVEDYDQVLERLKKLQERLKEERERLREKREGEGNRRPRQR